jgi:Tfp pilus assembly protein PilN
MKNHTKLSLNLASSPMRNRRLFFLIGFCLLVVFIASTILGVSIRLRYENKQREIEGELNALNKSAEVVKRQEIRYETLIEQTLAETKVTSDYINSLIYRKSFPWMEFFTAMENTLPDSSYIVSLTPFPVDGTKMEVRFQAVFTNLNELLTFIKNLGGKGFEDINIISESRSAEGFLLSEISVRYERHV